MNLQLKVIDQPAITCRSEEKITAIGISRLRNSFISFISKSQTCILGCFKKLKINFVHLMTFLIIQQLLIRMEI